jgi:hypothetical protein
LNKGASIVIAGEQRPQSFTPAAIMNEKLGSLARRCSPDPIEASSVDQLASLRIW